MDTVTLIWIMVVLAVLSGYVITSLILFKFPNLLHKRKIIKFRARHISHRGGAGENLENTMTAFRHAAAIGTHMIELDCHLTKDGEVVVAHDNHLKRSCGQSIDITETNLCDLPEMNCSLKLDFESNFVTQGSDDRCIPLLKDVFAEFPRLPINLDIKIDNNELIAKVSDLIKEYDREDITVWGSRLNNVCLKAYKENPQIPMFFSLKRVLLLLVLFYTGLLPFIPLKESFLEIIMPSILLDEKKFSMAISTRNRLLIRLMNALLIRPALFNHLANRGIQTYLWVLNNEEEFEKAFQSKATGVMTDFPTKLKTFLDCHKEYS